MGRGMLEMVVPGRRKRGRPKTLDVAREGTLKVGAVDGDEVDRVKWRRTTQCGEPG